MAYLVDDLEPLGYVERIAAPADRRAKLVRLTPRGRAAVLVAREAIAALEEKWTEQLGEAKTKHLRRLLEELSQEAGLAVLLPPSSVAQAPGTYRAGRASTTRP